MYRFEKEENDMTRTITSWLHTPHLLGRIFYQNSGVATMKTRKEFWYKYGLELENNTRIINTGLNNTVFIY